MSPKVRDLALGCLAIAVMALGTVVLIGGDPVGWLCLFVGATIFVGIARRRRYRI